MTTAAHEVWKLAPGPLSSGLLGTLVTVAGPVGARAARAAARARSAASGACYFLVVRRTPAGGEAHPYELLAVYYAGRALSATAVHVILGTKRVQKGSR